MFIRRYRPDLEKGNSDVDQYFGTTELPFYWKALGADYKHELLGTFNYNSKNYAYLKLPKVVTDLVVFVRFR